MARPKLSDQDILEHVVPFLIPHALYQVREIMTRAVARGRTEGVLFPYSVSPKRNDYSAKSWLMR